MHHRRLVVPALLSLGAVVACDERSAVDPELVLQPSRSTVQTVQIADEDRLAIDAQMRLLVDEGSEVSIESATVVLSTDVGNTTLEDPLVSSEDLPFEGGALWSDLSARLEVPAPVWGHDFLRGCRMGSVKIGLQLRIERGDSPARTVQSSMELPLHAASIAPNVFSSSGIIQSDDAVAPETSIELVPTPTGEVLVSLRTAGGARLYRADQDALSLVVDDFSWLDQARLRITPSASGDAIVGGRTGPFSVALHRFNGAGAQVGSGTIETAHFPAVEEKLELAALSRAHSGFFGVVRSAAPLVVGGVEHAAPTDKEYGSFLVQLDETLTPVAVTPLERDVRSWEVLEDGTILSTSTALPPSDDSSLEIQRLTAGGEILWTYHLLDAPHTLVVRPLADGGVLAAYQEPSNRVGYGDVTFVRLAGSDGTAMWSHHAFGTAPSIAVRGDGGAVLGLLGSDPSLDLGNHDAALLVELSPEGQVLRGAPIACGGAGAVVDMADGSTLLVGAFEQQMTLGETIRETHQQLVVSGVN
ncbi:MAG: hypothetical protein HOW73_15185 [Polyangiaceae bacterium]|nr:hypothetical protein [Polyangiaceae bacterium]